MPRNGRYITFRQCNASTNEKFSFYDDLDSILGTCPTSSAIKVAESSPASTSSLSTDVPSARENISLCVSVWWAADDLYTTQM